MTLEVVERSLIPLCKALEDDDGETRRTVDPVVKKTRQTDATINFELIIISLMNSKFESY